LKFEVSDEPTLMLQFAREAVENYVSRKDDDQLHIARRCMLKASKHAVLPDYWIDRFTADLNLLELAALSGADLNFYRMDCLKTLDAMALDFAR